MKKLGIFLLLLLGLGLGGCKDIPTKEKPNYIQFADELVENENPKYEYYYVITETNDPNIVIITFYRGVFYDELRFMVYRVAGAYQYNIEEGRG